MRSGWGGKVIRGFFLKIKPRRLFLRIVLGLGGALGGALGFESIWKLF